MRQLWPLNRASLETGPYYPFDNGPNGVNTLVAPQWLTRYSPILDSCKTEQVHQSVHFVNGPEYNSVCTANAFVPKKVAKSYGM